jgi:LysM repeat protein
MRFAEAEKEYRKLEEQLIRGELQEEQFLEQVANLRVIDAEGRRWRLSSRTGRWMLHDGHQWVFAEPDRKDPAAARSEPENQVYRTETPPVLPLPASPALAHIVHEQGSPPAYRPLAPRLLGLAVASLVLLGCLLGGGIAGWVFFLRDRDEPLPLATDAPAVSLVETYTPRPATATYTPTFTPTPSRTPTPTITPTPTDTPYATATSTATPTWTAQPPTPTTLPTQPSPTPVTVAAATATETPVSLLTYTVQLGDTLAEIADRFDVTVDALARANNISNQALIRPGQVLTIPAAGPVPTTVAQGPTATWTPIALATWTSTPVAGSQTYTVKAGDTLSTIAARFGVTVAALVQANGISDPTLIRVGQVLIIPVPGTTPATPTRTPAPTATRSGPTATPAQPGPTPTAGPTNTPRPAVTPTAQAAALSGKIAFTVWNPSRGQYELYVSRIDGGGRNRIGEGFRQPQFRPDGKMLAVNGDGALEYEHLAIMNPSGGELRGVSDHSEDSFPAWAPNGGSLAFSSSSWGDGKTRLGIVSDLFGRGWTWVPLGNAQIEGEYPFWMADGRLVYHGCDTVGGGGACGLYVVNSGGGNYRRLTDHQSDTAPAAAGSRIAFMSARDGNWEVYAINGDGSGLTRLTNHNAQDGLPTWSPDGRSIAFVSNRGGAWAIWVMDANGNNQRKLFDLNGGYGDGEYGWTSERISWAP